MFWAIVQRIGIEGITMLIFLVMTRLLSPKEFGILGMCYIWIGFIRLFSDLGFPSALIQKKDANEKHFSSMFFLNIIIGVILTLVGISLSGPSAIFFKDKNVQPVMAVLSFCFFIDSFSTMPKVILQKKLKFKSLAIRDIFASIFGGVAGIICALFNFGVWSLVVQALVTSFFGSVLIWHISQWKPHFNEFSFSHIKELWDYSSKILVSEVIKYVAQNYDRLFIGYFWGSTVLGLYSFAYKIAIFPLKELIKSVDSYIFPKFSLQQDDIGSLKKSCFFLLRTANAIFAPFVVLIVLSSSFFVPFIFGEKWHNAIILIQIFSIIGWTYLIISPVTVLMKVLNKLNWIIIWTVLFPTTALLLMWLGKPFGAVVSIVGLTITYIIGAIVSFFICTKLLKTNLKSILIELFPSTISSLGMGLLLIILINSFKSLSFCSPSLSKFILPIGLFLSCILYFLMMKHFDKTVFKDIWGTIVKSI